MEAKVLINTHRIIGEIHPDIYGQFLENMFDVVYGGVFEPGSDHADEAGFRVDALEALQELQVPNIRWPGGNFVSTYHWRDGIGPRASRPCKIDPNWCHCPTWKEIVEEPNTFGTDEFLELCRRLGATPYININSGTAGLEEALEWLEYCNCIGNSDVVKLRGENGHEAPYGVPYWGIGNEVFGSWQAGHVGADVYAEQLRQFAYFMKKVDPGIKILGVGHNEPPWNQKVLEAAGHLLDYLTLHFYTDSRHLEGKPDYYPNMAGPLLLERFIQFAEDQILEASMRHDWKHPIYISVDEWSLRHFAPPFPDGKVDVDRHDPRTMMDAVFAASVYHVFHRHAGSVKMANYVMMANHNAPVIVRPEGIIRSGVFDCMRLYRTLHIGKAVDCHVSGPGLEVTTARHVPIDMPFVDGSASIGGGGKLVFSLVNRHERETIQSSIDVHGFEESPGEAVIHRVTARSPLTANSFENPGAVRLSEECIPWRGTLDLPPCSVTVVEFGPRGTLLHTQPLPCAPANETVTI